MALVCVNVDINAYQNALAYAHQHVQRVKDNCYTADQIVLRHAREVQRLKHSMHGTGKAPAPGVFVLVKQDAKTVGGYAVISGELMGLWCNVPGSGDWLVRNAVRDGADRLDCFDGYLTKLYGRAGFKVILREPNYVEGGQDVVWMRKA